MAEQIEEIYLFVGLVIREARQQADLTQQELANVLNLTRTSVVNIEAGRQRILLHHLSEIANATGVELACFLPPSGGASLQMKLDVSREERQQFNNSKLRFDRSLQKARTTLWNALTTLDRLSDETTS